MNRYRFHTESFCFKQHLLVVCFHLLFVVPVFSDGSDTVEIRDDKFLDALIRMGTDQDGDGIINRKEAEEVKILGVSYEEISDMTGIEAFINLEELYCIGNQITDLDVSACGSLSLLDCGFNKLTELDLSANGDLSALYCGWNEITGLDVSNSEYLTYLDCGYNKLTALNISNNKLLEKLYCGWNLLKDLDVSSNTFLKTLYCTDNDLSELDLSTNSQLIEIYCGWNLLTKLEISNCTSLTFLECTSNQLTDLDLSEITSMNILNCGWNRLNNLETGKNKSLKELRCSNNLFNNLDLSGNNQLELLEIEYMSDLKKVCVWELPFPPDNVEIHSEGSPQILFTLDCGDMQAPVLEIKENSLYRPEFIEAVSSEEGMIYIVPENTAGCFSEICLACLDSVPAIANEAVSLSAAELSNGTYWLYAKDNSGNISNHQKFTVLGVYLETSLNDQSLIYPNPARDFVIIHNQKAGKYIIEIVSMDGRQLLSEENSDPTCKIDLSSLSEGVYFIIVRSEGTISTNKILKH